MSTLGRQSVERAGGEGGEGRGGEGERGRGGKQEGRAGGQGRAGGGGGPGSSMKIFMKAPDGINAVVLSTKYIQLHHSRTFMCTAACI